MAQGADPTEYGLPADAVEVVERRTRDSKTFQNPDGTFTAVLGQRLHFQATAGGPWLDPAEMVVQRSAPGTWTVTTSEIHIAANYSAMQITHLPTNQSWQWNFLGQGSGDSIIYQGIPWQYEPSPWGVKSHATVTERRGPQVYQWTYNTNIPDPTVDEAGNIRAGRFVIPRAFVIGANGERYVCGAWELAWPYVRFAFDDSALPPEAYPYVIDPTTAFEAHSESGFIRSQGGDYPTARSGGIGASRSLNTTAGVLIAGQFWYPPSAIYSVYETLLAFDISSLPDSPTVTSVELRLTVEDINGSTNYDVEARAHVWLPTLATNDWVSGGNLASLPLLATFDAADAVVDEVATFAEVGTALRDAVEAGEPIEIVIASSRTRTGTPPEFSSEFLRFYRAGVGTAPALVVDYTLPTGTLSGTVTDADTTAPIAGATVALDDDDESSTQTDAQGEYTLEGIAPGEYTATYSHPQYHADQHPVTITGGQVTSQDAALVPLPGNLVVSTALNDTKEQLPGVSLTLQPGGHVGVTNNDGEYVFEGLPTGDYTLSLDHPACVPEQVPVTVPAGDTGMVRRELVPRTGTLYGTITGADTGLPLGDIRIYVQYAGSGEFLIGFGQPDGTYSIDVRVGNQQVVFRDASFEYAEQTVPVTIIEGQQHLQHVVLDPAPGAAIVTVKDSHSGEPLGGVTVTFTPGNYSGITLSHGQVFIGDIPAGSYTVTASLAGFVTYVEPDVVIPRGKLTPVNIDLDPLTGSVAGTVTDSITTQGITGASVTLTPGNYQTTTGADGTYHLANVRTGVYTATYGHGGYTETARLIVVAEDQTTTQDVALAPVPGISFVEAAQPTAPTASSVTFPHPSTAEPGDVMLVQITHSQSSPSVTAPAGWELIADESYTGVLNARTRIWGKVLGTNEPANYTWSWSGSVGIVAGAALYRGVDPNDWLDAIAATVNSSAVSTHTAPSVAVSRPGNWVLRAYTGTNAQSRNWTGPSGHVTRYSLNGTRWIGLADAEQSSAGSSGTANATTNGTTRSINITLSLNVMSVPPAGTLIGRVVEAGTDTGIVGASVTLTPGNYQTTTGPGGTYALPDVPPDNYTATYSAPGYVTQQRPVTIVGGDTTFENVALQPAIVPKQGSDTAEVVIAETAVTHRASTATDAGEVVVAETAAITAIDLIQVTDSAVVDVTETSRTAQVHGVTDPAVVAADEAAALGVAAQASDDAAVAGTEGTPRIAQAVADSAAVAAVEGAPQIAQALADAAALGITETTRRRIIEVVREARLALVVYDGAGNRLGTGPITELIAPRYRLGQDEVGTLSLGVPATAESAGLLTKGREIRLWREGEGELYRAIVNDTEAEVDDAGGVTVQVSAASTARQLVWANTLLGRAFEGASVANAVDNLLSGTGWTRGTTGSTSNTVNARFEGTSIWKALVKVAETFGWHVVEDNIARTIDIGPAGQSSGLVLANVEQVSPEMAVLPIIRLRIKAGEDEVWNRVVPLGDGEGINRLTLEHSTRTSPYPIKSGTGPDGQPYWYIEDADSVAAYGARTQVLSVKDAVPLSNSPAAIQNAANALYDVAAAWLGWHSELQETYEVEIVGLTHRDPATGQARIRPGQTVRLVYRGLVEDERGRRLWKSIDRDLYVLDFERSFEASGADRWRLTVSTVDSAQPSDAGAIAKAIEDLWAIQTALKPVTFLMPFGPTRQSVDSSNRMSFRFELGPNVRYLHRADLVLVKQRVRSNARGAGSGAPHTHTISGHATQAGGGDTSFSGSPHSHTLTGLTSDADLSHYHILGNATTGTAWSDPPFQQQITLDSNAGSFGIIVGRGGTSSAQLRTADIGINHNHGVGGITAVSEGSHTHQMPAHTHSISGTATQSEATHTHPLEYGIFEGPAASTPQFRVYINDVDRTAALGGPWDGDATLDITQYLVTAEGFPVQTRNTIEIQSSQLCDVELSVRALVTISQLVPV